MFKSPATDAERALVEENIKLAVTLARRYSTAFRMPIEDLIQEGTIGLLSAAKKYDPSLGHKFSTYATWWIRQTITNYCRKQIAHGVTPGINTNNANSRPITYLLEDYESENDSESELSNCLLTDRKTPEPPEQFERSENSKMIREFIKTQPLKNRKVIRMWIAGHDGSEIEAALGISRQSVQQYLAKFVFEATQKFGNGCTGKYSLCLKCKRKKLSKDIQGKRCRSCRKRRKRA